MLNAEVLVLNRVYLPIRVTTARRAFCLLYQGKARVILPDYTTCDFESWAGRPAPPTACVRHVNGAIALPSVIVLRGFSGMPRHEVRFSRRNVFVRDAHRCQYCGVTLPARELNVDHVLPLSLGGRSSWENVVCCCVPCNRRKANRTPENAGMRLLRPPRRPRWHPLHDASRKAPPPDTWRHFVDAAILDWSPSSGPAA